MPSDDGGGGAGGDETSDDLDDSGFADEAAADDLEMDDFADDPGRSDEVDAGDSSPDVPASDDAAADDAAAVDDALDDVMADDAPLDDATADDAQVDGGVLAVGERCITPSSYPNLFSSLLDKTAEEVNDKVQGAFEQLFHGDNNQTVFYESGDDGYILDVNSNDVRSEGQSYGMMIAVQLDRQDEFDRIWRWTQRVMRQPSGTYGWHATTSGQLLSTGSAPDGEEYFAMALIFASHRWGDDTGINYAEDARSVLAAMYDQGLFAIDEQLVKFVSTVNYTDPSYILPSFYEVWACFDDDPERAAFWRAAADTGRAFFPKTVNPNTGLAPYLANYDGSARDDFNADSYRVVGNIMMDHYMYGVDPWQTTFAETYAAFFTNAQQAQNPGAEFTLDGNPTVRYGSPDAGLAAQNAMVAFGVPPEQGRYFVDYLWEMNIPTGQYRYYSGLLYMLSLLHVSGNFRVYH